MQFNYHGVRYYSIINARAASRASYSADPDKKRVTSHASYIADPDRDLPPHAAEGLPNAETGVKIKTYTTRTILKHIPFHHAHLHLYIILLPPPKKRPKTSYRKSTSPKSAKTSHVGMQKTLPQKPMKQATMHDAMHTDYLHITVQCFHRVATIPTSLQPHPHNPYHAPILNCTPN